MSRERDLEDRIHKIVLKHLNENCIPYFTNKDLQDIKVKTHTRSNLIKQIELQFTELISREFEVLSKQVQYLQEEVSQLKSLFSSNWNEKTAFSSMQVAQLSKSSSFLDLDSAEIDEKQIQKRLKDMEENMKKKFSQSENIINLLMDNQYLRLMQLKQQLSEIKLTGRNDEEIQRLSKEVKELKEKQKEREKFFWSVANDQSVKIDSLKKELENKNDQKQQQSGLFRRASLLGFK